MSITRTITIEDITPAELGKMFAHMDEFDQASFLRTVHDVAMGWAGAGWCQQSYAIARVLTDEGREVISTLASHCLNRDQLQALIEAQEA